MKAIRKWNSTDSLLYSTLGVVNDILTTPIYELWYKRSSPGGTHTRKKGSSLRETRTSLLFYFLRHRLNVVELAGTRMSRKKRNESSDVNRDPDERKEFLKKSRDEFYEEDRVRLDYELGSKVTIQSRE